MSLGQFKYSELDDSIFEHLRRFVVAQGYYPDLTAYQPENPSNRTALEAALQAIKTGGKQPINTIATGVSKDKGEVKLNAIYVTRVSNKKGAVAMFDTSTIRTDGLNTPPNAGTTYARVSAKGFTQDVDYELRYIADTQQNAEVISNIIQNCFTLGFNYYSIIDLVSGTIDDTRKFLLEFLDFQDLNVFEFKEYLYRFTVKDAWIVTSNTLPDGVQTIVDNTIVPIVEITMDIETD